MKFMREWSEKLGYGKSDGKDRWPDGLFLPPLDPGATEAIRYDLMDTKRRASDDNGLLMLLMLPTSEVFDDISYGASGSILCLQPL